ncbi:MAG TPA: hypothetical protein VN524_10225 [Hyphomicrobiaceae bacterium]|jgi:hypothetical protein|nr:hypothetical protein [Hyphomicrobiaceae bacterium]
MHRTTRVSTALFFLGFLAVGMIGAQTLAAAFEPVRSEYLGASAFLFLLCLVAVLISTYSYVRGSRQDGRHPGWLAGLLGGAIAGGSFCGSVGAGYAGLGGYSLVLAVVLPPGFSLLWPFLSAKALGGQPN